MNRKLLLTLSSTLLTGSLLAGPGAAAAGAFADDAAAFRAAEAARADWGKKLAVTTDYKFALRTADQFLIAWLNRDLNAGLTLITDKVKQEAGPNGLFAFFTGTSNPHHQAFEVIGQRKVDADTYRFRVWLYEHYTGQQEPPVKRGRGLTIDVVRTGANAAGEGIWLVNNLPLPPQAKPMPQPAPSATPMPAAPPTPSAPPASPQPSASPTAQPQR